MTNTIDLLSITIKLILDPLRLGVFPERQKATNKAQNQAWLWKGAVCQEKEREYKR